MKIRKAKYSDRIEWLRLRKLLWPECSADRHSLEIDLISSSPGIVIVAELSKSSLMGFAEVSIRNDHVEGTKNSPVPYLEGWYVEPEYRGKGIGKALIKAAEDFAVSKGFKELASDSEIENKSGIEIHKSIGFKEVGRSVHFVKSL
ncbi:MAG: GNAT family N-acetyltransferase [Deltaproteobacteria bacterium]|nr:GNAT family N-acetyltransferase [Deltaproteobacteria bacterium]